MKLFNASHLEVKKDLIQDFETHPYEVGWADECIFFIAVENVSGSNSVLAAAVEISHDGVHWVAEGTISEPIMTKGLHFLRVKHFGNWLRLHCRITGNNPVFRLNIQIALKG
ncbi:DUF6385 domain-containing protein [Sphingobacterium chuzhouense]|uniref:DUF6385 domain-containing protein n=1 Tax=Sphingobacterium chuzhouense TaxID=1742264 RepID=UPI001CC1CAD5|nr:DUF6385 domain-containing protein [Sphingobacterium chuzhouense]